jgi:uncharacterized coiled-coil protein SlyX
MNLCERIANWLAPAVSLQIRYDQLERKHRERRQTIDHLCQVISAHKREISALTACVNQLKREQQQPRSLQLVVSDDKGCTP